MSTPATTLVAPDVARLEAEELGQLLQQATRRPVIVDVRDPATAGGFIKGAVNIPKIKFESDDFVNEFIAKYKDEEVLVFHCLNSNGRGPFCAGRIHDALKEHDVPTKPEVRILKGGFRVFLETHGADSELVDPSDLH